MVITLTEQVYDRIKRDIMLHNLVPGQKLNYKTLSESYGISETPIKQALHRMVADGIVLSEPNRGMWIKKYGRCEIEDIIDTRLMFESYNVDCIYSTINGNMRIRRRIQENLQKHAEIAEHYDPENIQHYIDAMEIDDEFHKHLMYCTGNQTMVDLYTRLKAFVFAFHTFGLQSKERIQRNVVEHTRIFEGLISDDVENARKAIVSHNRSSKQNTVMMFKMDDDMEY